MHREELEVTAELNELISVEWYEDCVFQTFSVRTCCEEEAAVFCWVGLCWAHWHPREEES